MVATSEIDGKKVFFDEKDGIWRYCETKEPVSKPDQKSVVDILKECLHALETQDGLYVYDKDGPHTSEAWQIDNSTLIDQIKEVI